MEFSSSVADFTDAGNAAAVERRMVSPLSLSLSLYIHIYIYIHMYISMYMYISIDQGPSVSPSPPIALPHLIWLPQPTYISILFVI